MDTVLITGAGTGLGRELALAFAKKGFYIIATGRRSTLLEETIQLIEKENGKGEAIKLDVTSNDQVNHLAQSIGKKHAIKVLINNAGIGHFGPLSTTTNQEISEMFQVNVIGTINMSRAFIPYMERENKSYLLNIISTAGLRGKKHESAYCASKFAVRGFTESLQVELNETSIQPVAVYMGGMDTPFWDLNDYIKDKSRLRSAKEVAEEIVNNYSSLSEIIVEDK